MNLKGTCCVVNGSLISMFSPFPEHDFSALVGHHRGHDLRSRWHRTSILELHVVIVQEVSEKALSLHGSEKSLRNVSPSTILISRRRAKGRCSGD